MIQKFELTPTAKLRNSCIKAIDNRVGQIATAGDSKELRKVVRSLGTLAQILAGMMPGDDISTPLQLVKESISGRLPNATNVQINNLDTGYRLLEDSIFPPLLPRTPGVGRTSGDASYRMRKGSRP